MYTYIKNILDCFFAVLLLIILSPLLVIIAILVKVFNGSPILFKQERPGYQEKIFTIYKFRTMVDKPDLIEKERITKLGKFLRETSLDELPELINIIKGEMSFVGPRPLLVKYLPLYNNKQKRRHNVKPGLTGLAQVKGRNAISFEERFEYDVYYVDNMSFVLDLRIVFLTFWKIIKREGVEESAEFGVRSDEFLTQSFREKAQSTQREGSYKLQVTSYKKSPPQAQRQALALHGWGRKRNSEFRTPNSELRTPNSELRTNILLTSAGRRVKLVQQLKQSLNGRGNIVVTDADKTAPVMYFADKGYVVPIITDENYINKLLDICDKENIRAITTLIDPEIEILAKHRDLFLEKEILLLIPSYETARLCFDKYSMYEYLTENKIDTPKTYLFLSAEFGVRSSICPPHEACGVGGGGGGKSSEFGFDYPVFIKPRYGSGGVGARKVNSEAEYGVWSFFLTQRRQRRHREHREMGVTSYKLQVTRNPARKHRGKLWHYMGGAESGTPNSEFIIQEFMDGENISVDAYIDCISGELISMFCKKKIESKIGGANKVITFKDNKLTAFIKDICRLFQFKGPVDFDLFYQEGRYILCEINPRFGGGYVYAHAMGVDFVPYIMNNIEGRINKETEIDYEENVILMMWDDVVRGSRG